MYSREIAKVRRENKTCKQCGCGGKLECHHTIQPNWTRIIDVIREELLDPNKLVMYCHNCHAAHTKAQRAQKTK
jgi:hypothetical protein